MSILCVGQLVADMVVRPVRSLPAASALNRVEELQLVAGGCAANTASVLAKLGVSTAIAGLIGQDALGDAVLSEIEACGVDVSHVVRNPLVQTSAVIVIVDEDGERSFLYRNGGNEQLASQDISDEVIRRADILHIGGVMKLNKLDLGSFVQRVKGLGCTISIDTDWIADSDWLSKLEPALSHTDYLLTNEEEGAMLTGEKCPWAIGRALLNKGPRMVIVKRGANGSIAVTDKIEKEFPAFDVKVLDTTCAGDGFAAGFLFSLSEGWELDKAVTFANAVGGLCTTEISHRGVTSLSATLDFVNSQSDVAAADRAFV